MTDRRGVFVVFEGGDGAGKTTQVERLGRWLTAAGHDVVSTFEPGGTGLGRLVRSVVLDHETGDLAPRAEALLYAADKAQHLHEVVRPALRRGAVVVCDRYVDSMLAYQGAGRALPVSELAAVARWATDSLRPDLTVVLDVEPARAVQEIISKDRLEAAGDGFHRRVRNSFLELAGLDPERYLVLDARLTRDEIAERVADRLRPILSAVAGTLDP